MARPLLGMLQSAFLNRVKSGRQLMHRQEGTCASTRRREGGGRTVGCGGARLGPRVMRGGGGHIGMRQEAVLRRVAGELHAAADAQVHGQGGLRRFVQPPAPRALLPVQPSACPQRQRRRKGRREGTFEGTLTRPPTSPTCKTACCCAGHSTIRALMDWMASNQVIARRLALCLRLFVRY